MKHNLNAGLSDLMAGPTFQGPVAIGRFLLMLATISMLTAPLTQVIWTWDHFLHGGQDFETGILTIVIILCLAVLLSQLCKRLIYLSSSFGRMLAFTLNHGVLPGRFLNKVAFFIVRNGWLDDAAAGEYCLPLRI